MILQKKDINLQQYCAILLEFPWQKNLHINNIQLNILDLTNYPVTQNGHRVTKIPVTNMSGYTYQIVSYQIAKVRPSGPRRPKITGSDRI